MNLSREEILAKFESGEWARPVLPSAEGGDEWEVPGGWVHRVLYPGAPKDQIEVLRQNFARNREATGSTILLMEDADGIPGLTAAAHFIPCRS